MRIIALNASPNQEGLTALCAQAVLAGGQEAGAQVRLIHLCDLDLRVCQACENGWGQCRREGRCIQQDDFAQVREEILAADAWVLATPVYFGEPSEIARVLLDRLRRCNTGPEGGQLQGKDFLGICAAEARAGDRRVRRKPRAHQRTHGDGLADLILVTRRTKLYKVDCLKAAGKALVEQPWEE